MKTKKEIKNEFDKLVINHAHLLKYLEDVSVLEQLRPKYRARLIELREEAGRLLEETEPPWSI